MKVLAHDPYVTPAAAREVEVELVTLDELLKRADVISLHTSLSAATEKMFGAAAFAKMKRGARLVNCARGELIDEAALAEALKSGQLAARGGGYVCGGTAEEFAADRIGEFDRDAAHCGIDGRGAGRSGHGGGAAGARLSGGRVDSQRGEYAGAFAGAVSEAASLY